MNPQEGRRGCGAVTFFSSDTHFCHGLVAGKRGFASSAEHDDEVIRRWNSVVRAEDMVWHVGDVGLGNDTQVLERASRLNGRKHLVPGKHDRCWPGHTDSRKHQRRWLEVFESVQAFARVRLGARMVLLSHTRTRATIPTRTAPPSTGSGTRAGGCSTATCTSSGD